MVDEQPGVFTLMLIRTAGLPSACLYELADAWPDEKNAGTAPAETVCRRFDALLAALDVSDFRTAVYNVRKAFFQKRKTPPESFLRLLAGHAHIPEAAGLMRCLELWDREKTQKTAQDKRFESVLLDNFLALQNAARDETLQRALLFASHGARVLCVDRDVESAAETAAMITAEGGTAAVLRADVTDEADVARIPGACLDTFGRIDVLHNNVGIGAGDAPPHRLSDDAYDRIMDVNLRAMWRTCRAAVPVLRAQERSAIVNVSSLAAVAGATGLTAYKLSKAGVNALTQNLALSGAKHGMRANAIMPGFIDTPMAVDAAASALGVDRFEYAAARAAMVPLGRQGTAWDVANAALFLASDEAAFVTGVLLPVDGGQAARIG